MKLAVITDSSAVLNVQSIERDDLFVLSIPVSIDGENYIEGQNLTVEEFYQKMA
ncbi:TPA: DegV family protein, partial [Streptococcus suis]|nr:DegV family protein [Streptococcus suis]